MPFFTGLWRHSREDLMKKECLARSTADEFGGEGRGLVGERGGEDHVAGRKGLFGLLGDEVAQTDLPFEIGDTVTMKRLMP